VTRPEGRIVGVGDTAEIGDLVGMAMEPDYLYARVVGFRTAADPAMRAVLRRFRPDDGRWPTGGYVSTWCLIPWTGRSGVWPGATDGRKA
jgi:hypothetical protein